MAHWGAILFPLINKHVAHIILLQMITQWCPNQLVFQGLQWLKESFKKISLPVTIKVDLRVAPQSENHPNGTAFTTCEEREDI